MLNTGCLSDFTFDIFPYNMYMNVIPHLDKFNLYTILCIMKHMNGS